MAATKIQLRRLILPTTKQKYTTKKCKTKQNEEVNGRVH